MTGPSVRFARRPTVVELPPGARMVPWHFFADDMPMYELREWEVWLGGDHWLNVLSLMEPLPRCTSLREAPNGLQVIARMAEDDREPLHRHSWVDSTQTVVLKPVPDGHCHLCGRSGAKGEGHR